MTDNRTTELRRLLNERGVEWKDYGYENHTWWSGSENVGWHAENRPSAIGLYVKIEAVLTPEQAIAATLGGGECEFSTTTDNPPTCSNCKWQADIYDCDWLDCGEYEYDGRYCKQCGAKVKAVKR